MSESLETVKKLIEECSEVERNAVKLYLRQLAPHPPESEWDVDADTILNAIDRASDLTKRGVRGIIAEAVFVNEVLPSLEYSGWWPVEFYGDLSYDALLRKNQREARIQVKLQRLEQGVPKLYYPKYYEKGILFVVEVQKTRTGERTTKTILPTVDAVVETVAAAPVVKQTRPYSFGDFDILAVNMHPSMRNWRCFRYTVASWLIPRVADPKLIEIFQPVSAVANEVWTDNLATCLQWLEDGVKRSDLRDVLHPRKGTPKAAN